MVAPWTEYTDHNPLSVRLRVGQRWADTSRRKHSIPKPNLAKLSGTGPTAEALRKQWTQEVEARFEIYETQHTGRRLGTTVGGDM